MICPYGWLPIASGFSEALVLLMGIPPQDLKYGMFNWRRIKWQPKAETVNKTIMTSDRRYFGKNTKLTFDIEMIARAKLNSYPPANKTPQS
jgi:hypothetical protein